MRAGAPDRSAGGLAAETRVRGLVVGAEWGEDGRVLRVNLEMIGEDRIHVVPDEVGARLIRHLREWVIVRGVLKDRTGEAWIKVLDFLVGTDD